MLWQRRFGRGCSRPATVAALPATAIMEDEAVLEVLSSPKGGRGVFATRRIRRDALLMSAPLLLVPAEQRDALQSTIVDDYVYEWDGEGTAALVLGVSSMCNHDPEPNAYLWLVPEDLSAELWSIRPIRSGDEVTVSYRAAGDPDAPLWFELTDDGPGLDDGS